MNRHSTVTQFTEHAQKLLSTTTGKGSEECFTRMLILGSFQGAVGHKFDAVHVIDFQVSGWVSQAFSAYAVLLPLNDPESESQINRVETQSSLKCLFSIGVRVVRAPISSTLANVFSFGGDECSEITSIDLVLAETRGHKLNKSCGNVFVIRISIDLSVHIFICLSREWNFEQNSICTVYSWIIHQLVNFQHTWVHLTLGYLPH